jgi:hypothetical protein
VAEFAGGEEIESHSFRIRPCALLRFNLEKDVFEPVFAARVKYRAEFQEISKNADNVHEVHWAKHPDWATEKEWRMIWEQRESLRWRASGAKGSEPVERRCLPFAPEGLRSVIFGMRMQPKIKERLHNMLDQEAFKHVRKETTDIDPETGELVLKPLESCQ